MSNEKQQTAVYILCEKLAMKLSQQAITFYIDHQEEIREAKEMEKEQMKHWFELGMHLVEGRLWKPVDKFEENFNETYGGNK
jgi:hypothetical protein